MKHLRYFKIIFKNSISDAYYSTSLEATETFFISGDIECLPVCFEYKMAFEDYLVAEIYATQFWVKRAIRFCGLRGNRLLFGWALTVFCRTDSARPVIGCLNGDIAYRHQCSDQSEARILVTEFS